MVQWLKLHTSNTGGLSSIPGQGTKSPMPQPRVLVMQVKISHATTKTEDLVCHDQALLQPSVKKAKNTMAPHQAPIPTHHSFLSLKQSHVLRNPQTLKTETVSPFLFMTG